MATAQALVANTKQGDWAITSILSLAGHMTNGVEVMCLGAIPDLTA